MTIYIKRQACTDRGERKTVFDFPKARVVVDQAKGTATKPYLLKSLK